MLISVSEHAHKQWHQTCWQTTCNYEKVRPRSEIAPIVLGLGLNWIKCSVRNGYSAAFLGFLNFIQRGFFVRTVRAAQKYTEERLLLITVKTAQTMLIPTLPPSMNPAHCIGWVLSAGQGPTQMFQKLGLDGGPGLRSLISLIKRDQNCYACNTCAAILIDCLIRTHSKDESLMTSVYYSDLRCKSKWMLQRTLSPTPDWTS